MAAPPPKFTIVLPVASEEPPTSIPSPFARFDLVRTAFAKLSQSETLDGEPNDKRLVSECFDVGQIFFNYDTDLQANERN